MVGRKIDIKAGNSSGGSPHTSTHNCFTGKQLHEVICLRIITILVARKCSTARHDSWNKSMIIEGALAQGLCSPSKAATG